MTKKYVPLYPIPLLFQSENI